MARTGSRQEQLSGTRRRIIEGTRQMLAEGGLEALNLKRIERAVGVARSTIHCHFESRLGLLQAVLEDALQRGGMAFIEAAAAAHDAVEALDLLIAQSCHMWAVDYVIWRRLMALAALAPEAERVVSAWDEQRYRLILDLVARLADAQELADGQSLHSVAGAIWALTSYATFERLLLATGSEAQVIAILRLFARGLYGAGRSPFALPEDSFTAPLAVSNAAMLALSTRTRSSVVSVVASAASKRNSLIACSGEAGEPASRAGLSTPWASSDELVREGDDETLAALRRA